MAILHSQQGLALRQTDETKDETITAEYPDPDLLDYPLDADLIT